MLSVVNVSCVIDPLLACKVSVHTPAAALLSERRVKVCNEFALTIIGKAGFVVVMAGKPVSVMDTDPLNPFCPTTETVTGALVPPCTKLTEVDENVEVRETVKSGEGWGGLTGAEGPPPHDSAVVARATTMNTPEQANPRGAFIRGHVGFCLLGQMWVSLNTLPKEKVT